jgi:hypothetical protein
MLVKGTLLKLRKQGKLLKQVWPSNRKQKQSRRLRHPPLIKVRSARRLPPTHFC